MVRHRDLAAADVASGESWRMMRFGAALALAIILPVIGAPYAAAQSRPEQAPASDTAYVFTGDAASTREIYTVRDIPVDEVAATTAVARQTAIGRARRMALARILRRIVLADDQSLVPDLGDRELADLIAGFEVAGEKSSGTRYLAQLTIRFDEDRVRAMLRRAGARFSETASKPVLVVPIYEAAGTRALWEQPNPWKEALAAAIAAEEMAVDGLLPMRLPRGDLPDLLLVSADQAAAGDMARLRELAARYGLESLLIVHATQSYDATTGSAQLTVTTRMHGNGAHPTVQVTQFDAGAQHGFHAPVARASVRQLENAWKADTWLDFSQESHLVVTTPLTSLAQWQTMRGRLRDISRIRRIGLRALSVRHANMLLTYLGTPDQLVTALAQHGLELAEEDGYWLLRQPSGRRAEPD